MSAEEKDYKFERLYNILISSKNNYSQIVNTGDYFFRYRNDSEDSLSALEMGELWFSNPIEFEDINDASFSDNSDDNISKESAESFLLFLKRLRNKSMVACFTTRNDNEKMWKEYASNYSGFVIKYSYGDIFRQLRNRKQHPMTNQFALLLCRSHSGLGFTCGIDTIDKKYDFFVEKVNYSNKQNEDTPDLIRRLCYWYDRNENPTREIELKMSLSMRKVFLTKEEKYSYEEEIRIVLLPQKYNDNEQKVHVSTIDKIIPKAVYLGDKVEVKTEKRIRKYCLENGIELYIMRPQVSTDNKCDNSREISFTLLKNK